MLSRNSAGPNPIYPTSGTNLSLSLQLTPPYSLFNNVDYSDPDMIDSERYKWVEYHKWGFKSDWFITLAGNLNPSGRKLVLFASLKQLLEKFCSLINLLGYQHHLQNLVQQRQRLNRMNKTVSCLQLILEPF